MRTMVANNPFQTLISGGGTFDGSTPPKFNIALKNDGWKTRFLLGRPIFGDYIKPWGCIASSMMRYHDPGKVG